MSMGSLTLSRQGAQQHCMHMLSCRCDALACLYGFTWATCMPTSWPPLDTSRSLLTHDSTLLHRPMRVLLSLMQAGCTRSCGQAA